MNPTYIPYLDTTPPAPDLREAIKDIGDWFDPAESDLGALPQTIQAQASSPVIGETERKSRRTATKRIAWGSFTATVLLVSTAVVSLLARVHWLAALAGFTAIAAYGLLYTAGLSLNKLDRVSVLIIRE